MNSAVTSMPIGTPAATFPGRERAARGRLLRWARWLWRVLEASGQARAQRHLLDFADQCEANQPELAKELRAACCRADAA